MLKQMLFDDVVTIHCIPALNFISNDHVYLKDKPRVGMEFHAARSYAGRSSMSGPIERMLKVFSRKRLWIIN